MMIILAFDLCLRENTDTARILNEYKKEAKKNKRGRPLSEFEKN